MGCPSGGWPAAPACSCLRSGGGGGIPHRLVAVADRWGGERILGRQGEEGQRHGPPFPVRGVPKGGGGIAHHLVARRRGSSDQQGGSRQSVDGIVGPEVAVDLRRQQWVPGRLPGEDVRDVLMRLC